MKKLKYILLIGICSFVFGFMSVNADTAHQMSFNAYKCDSLNSSYECNGTPTLLSENGAVNPGDVIKLDLYYVPGTQVDKSMQIRFTFNDAQLEPVYNGSNLVFTPALTPMFDGIYPAMGTSGYSAMLTNWTIQANQSGNIMALIIKDNTLNDPLTTAGVLTSLYFTVKSTATPGADLAFTYLPAHTLMANESPINLTNRTVKVYKALDGDTSLSSIAVTNGSTNYLTNFNKNTKEYTVYVPNQVSTVNISVEATSSTTDIVYAPSAANNNYSLNVSTTKTVTITTQAENDDTDTYTVNVYRLSNADTLTALSLSGVDIGEFSSTKLNYTATVPFATSKTNITATRASNKATITGTGSNKTINEGSNNVFNIVVTPENCKSDYNGIPNNNCTGPKTYSVTVTRLAASTNNYLSYLTVNGESVTYKDGNQTKVFNKTHNDYVLADVNGNVNTITIAAEVEDTGKASFPANAIGTKNLTEGNNTFNIVVTPESTTPTRTYSVSVYKKSNVTNLSGLSITSSPQGTLDSNFTPGNKNYTYTVGPDVTSVTITPTSNNHATITSNGTSNGNGGFTFDPRTDTQAVFHVVSEDETSETDYTVTLVRTLSNIATLDDLVVENYNLSPSFTDDTKNYSVSVPYNVTQVTILPDLTDDRASYEIKNVSSNLAVGDNDRKVTVTAEDNQTKKYYNLNIHRKSNNTLLSSLTFNGSSIEGFAEDKSEYNITVPYATDKVTITGTKKHSGASVSGNVTNKSINVGSSNQVVLTVTAEDTSISRNVVINITRTAASTNNDLDWLKVDNESVPNFDKDTTSYNVTVDSTVSIVEITAGAHDPLVKSVGGTGSLTLGNPGTTKSRTVTVTAESGATKEYIVNVYRQNNDATLSSLSVTSDPQGTLNPSTFNPATKTYTYNVDSNVESVSIFGTLSDSKGLIVSGNGNYNPKNQTKAEIITKAEDRNIPDKYTINFNRVLSKNNYLDTLEVAGYDIEFTKDTPNYELTVNSDVEELTVSATVEDTGRASITSDSNIGVNVINSRTTVLTIKVQSEDTTVSPRVYTITVTRKDATNTLSNLVLEGITLPSPGFASGTNNYSVTVPYTVEKTKVTTATPTSSYAQATYESDYTILNVGSNNTVTVSVQSEDTNIEPNIYTVTITREAASTTATLSKLIINGVEYDDFDPDQHSYVLDPVAHDVESISIDAEPTDPNAVILGDTGDNLDVNPGNNTYTIYVQPQDPTKDPGEYTISLRRQSGDTSLDSLSITSDPQGTLTPDNLTSNTYTYNVGPSVDSVTIAATPHDPGARVTEGEGTYNPKNVTLVTLKIEAEDGTPREITINLVRSKYTGVEPLSLGVSGHNIGFDPSITEYTLNVDSSETSVTLVGQKAYDEQSIEGLGNKELQPGANVFEITVSAEDITVTPKVYTITVNQVLDTNNLLDGISINGVPIEGFQPTNTEYTVDGVDEDTETIEIAVTKGSSKQQVTGDGTVQVQPGDNRLPIVVTPESGEPTTYYININRAQPASINNYLKNLFINDVEVQDFDKTEPNYTVEVPYTDETIKVYAEPEDNTSVVVGIGDTLQLNDNGQDTVITISVIPQADESQARNYYLTVTKGEATEYITSVRFGHIIEDGYVKDGVRKTTSDTFKEQFDNEKAKLHVYANSEATEEILDTDFVATGQEIRLIKNGVLNDSKIIVVKGDVDGNGKVTLFDTIKIFSHLLDSEPITGVYLLAADVDNNNKVTLFDTITIFSWLLEEDN